MRGSGGVPGFATRVVLRGPHPPRKGPRPRERPTDDSDEAESLADAATTRLADHHRRDGRSEALRGAVSSGHPWICMASCPEGDVRRADDRPGASAVPDSDGMGATSRRDHPRGVDHRREACGEVERDGAGRHLPRALRRLGEVLGPGRETGRDAPRGRPRPGPRPQRLHRRPDRFGPGARQDGPTEDSLLDSSRKRCRDRNSHLQLPPGPRPDAHLRDLR